MTGSLTVLIPTRNEADNVQLLLERLSNSLSAPAVVIFVDDSDDRTPQVVQQNAGRFALLDVRLVHRSRCERPGGLGGAVLRGLHCTDTTWVCVMDGDLQHPPERVPALLHAAEARGADLVVGSRYTPGGRNEGLGAVRTLISWGSTVAAKTVFPRRLRGVRDPMSGFFLFRREAVTAPMTPHGFKILLEIAVRHPALVKCEVPFVFVERSAGASKGTLREGLRYLHLLADMRWSLRPRHGVRMAEMEPAP